VANNAIEGNVIYLYYGQGSIAEADFYRDWDQRPLFSASGAGATLADFNKMGTDANGQFIVDANGNVGLMQ
jgi:hypothetical protein